MSADRLVATVRKNGREEYRLQIRTDRQGVHRNVDVRLFIANGKGLMEPTPKGVSIQPALIRPMIEALQRAEREAEAEGLITAGES